MKHTMEPIVPLGAPGRLGLERWWELLYRGGRRTVSGHIGATPAEWRDWYAYLPSILESTIGPDQSVRVSVNVSTYQLLDSRIREHLVDIARWGQRVAIEWTEDPLHETLPGKCGAAAFLTTLRSRFSVLVGIDDVGAGEDGMGRMILLDEPPDFVKLDGSVLRSVHARRALEALLTEQVVGFRKLGIEVVGEHIETFGLLSLAERLNLSYVQGFLFPHREGTFANSLNSCGQSRTQKSTSSSARN
jgi:EAL domain-containing protein (putative c-di-GMP-specific phosphodiesterase class I)